MIPLLRFRNWISGLCEGSELEVEGYGLIRNCFSNMNVRNQPVTFQL